MIMNLNVNIVFNAVKIFNHILNTIYVFLHKFSWKYIIIFVNLRSNKCDQSKIIKILAKVALGQFYKIY